MGIAVKQSVLDQMYREALGDFRDEKEFLWKHRGGFVHFIQAAIADGRLSEAYSRKHFKLERLSYALDPARDRLLNNTVLATLNNHLITNAQGRLCETPQYYWMRQAMADSMGQANPTRAALKRYDYFSQRASLRPESLEPSDIFNSQTLLFNVTQPVLDSPITSVPAHFFDHGWLVMDDVEDELEALRIQGGLINSVNRARQPISLAKADQIPVCDDIVSTSFQVLHFDMGHPLEGREDQLFVSHVGIYLPKSTGHTITARTRVVELDGILRHVNLPAEELEAKVANYVVRHGDGWTGHNTYRLAAFVRLLDALADQPALADQIDKTVGQWFGTEQVGEDEAYRMESEFFAKHGIDLNAVEHQVRLSPGQLLLLDNTRVIHGRIGRRRAKELFNYMWGIERIGPEEIARLRGDLCRRIVGS